MFMSSVPEELTCQACIEVAKPKGLNPFSILFCRKKPHAETRAPYESIKSTFEKYLGKFTPRIHDWNLKCSVNFMRQVYSATPCTSSMECKCCEKPTQLGIETPTINTHSGTIKPTNLESVIAEKSDHSFYMMQTLRFGDTDVLTFFDSGANINIISGELATSQNLQIISKKPSQLTVVGGSSIRTEYGTYRCCLGPNEKGEYFEITCQGMDKVTSKFTKYDLTEIAREFKDQVDPNLCIEPTPQYIGGSDVKLLIGIRNTNLCPILLQILPSGVAVYKSPFTDIWGSRLIFAGPHSSFTKANGGIKADITNAVFHMKQDIDRNPWEERQIHPSIQIDKRFNISIHPHPINDKDIIDIGGGIIENEEPPLHLDEGNEAHYCGVHKIGIPIQKMRELINDDNPASEMITYRCDECAKCITCRRSPRLNAISLQEAVEQDLIERSVTIDTKNRKVIAKLPFVKDPVEYLSEKHNSNSNIRQAKSIYFTQCKKPEIEKEGIRKAQAELVERGFMIKLDKLPGNIQDMIQNAPFRHFYPWFSVLKDDSLSTPVRLVVDPTRTGLNVILPKGENRISRILDIVARNRTMKYAWVSDVSKLYNQLILDESAYPYSLFLFNESLEQGKEPDIYVMTRAWYGVISTGGQAGYALDELANQGKQSHPNATSCLNRDRYVDDIVSGTQTMELREKQIQEVSDLLAQAGFNLKYVVRSGTPPGEKASNDGKTIKLLGYKWDTELDILSPGVDELNMNTKRGGKQKSNEEPVETQEDAEKMLEKVSLTRRMIISKISELFDPLGIWEPLKLQLKLKSAHLSSSSWDEKLNQPEQVKWKACLKEFVHFQELTAHRYPKLDNEKPGEKRRLICISDAGQNAGGAAIYQGIKTTDGNWHTALLCSKSRLMKGTVPRNELSAILLMAELAFIVKKALGDQVGDIIYLTDSTIALSWIHNTRIKVRAYVFARVQSTRKLMEMTTENKTVPLFHIDGTANLADLLTKPHEISMKELSIGSTWQDGHDWMSDEVSNFPISQYENLTVSLQDKTTIKEECFSEPFLLEQEDGSVHTIEKVESENKFLKSSYRNETEVLIDPIALGWMKSLRILSVVKAYPHIIIHDRLDHKISLSEECIPCLYPMTSDYRDCMKQAKNYIFKYETQIALKSLSPKQLKKYTLTDGILYFYGRLSKDNPFKFKDLDNVPFLDSHEISGPLPIMLIDSPFLYSMIMYIHCRKLPHAGVEITVKEIFKHVLVHGGVRRMIRKIKEDCTTCRILDRKTVELEMSNHHHSRTTIAPPFYHMMCDVAFGFKGQAYKRARTSIKLYALVCVCMLTGATNILCLEGLETQDVVGALERHASRHGVPAHVYVDNGTQLLSLKQVKFSIRDVDAQLHESLGLRVHESTAKAHSDRGRVERKIRTIRSLLERTGVQVKNPLTALGWETIFAKISSAIDDLPMARGDTSTVSNLGFDILTANRIKLGRNNFRSLEEGGFDLEASKIPTNILMRNREIYAVWFQLFIDNVHMFQMRPDKWSSNSRLPIENDIVLFVFTDANYAKEKTNWRLARVLSCKNGKVELSYVSKMSKTGISKMGKLTRSVRDVSIVFSIGELFINTTEHHEGLFHVLFNE